MQVTKIVFILPYLISIGDGNMVPFISGGENASIIDFPYMAHLGTACDDPSEYTIAWICGASILNQRLVLTAGHCVFGCPTQTKMTLSVGRVYKLKGGVTTSDTFIIHENYNDVSYAYDIALVRVKTPLKFGLKVKRVALIQNPPYDEEASIAGWGLIDEKTMAKSPVLKYINQNVWDRQTCSEIVDVISVGTICASSTNPNSFAARGDSGSPLVVRGYIQIGLVSVKSSQENENVIVYTDIGYFYDWIEKSSKRLECLSN